MGTYEVLVGFNITGDDPSEAVNKVRDALEQTGFTPVSYHVNHIAKEDQVQDEPFSGEIKERPQRKNEHMAWCVLDDDHDGKCSADKRTTFADSRTRQGPPDDIEHVTPVTDLRGEDKENPRK